MIGGRYGPIAVVPPDPGTGACFALRLGQDGSGDRYSARFGADSTIKNVGGRLFKATKPSLEGVCPDTTPTTTTTTTTSTTIEPTTTTTTSTTTSTTTTTTTTGDADGLDVPAPTAQVGEQPGGPVPGAPDGIPTPGSEPADEPDGSTG